MRRRAVIHPSACTACVAAAFGVLVSCQPQHHPEPATRPPPVARIDERLVGSGNANPATRSAEAWRSRLLEQAMDIASAPPQKAHASVRSRLQRDVAEAEIDLGLIDAALRHAAAIDDWREGEVLALAAQALATGGQRERARTCVDRAADIAAGAGGWRKERIQTEVAVALAMLGDVEMARRFAAGVPQELTGRVEARLCERVPVDELDRQCDAFDTAIATGSFDVVRSGVNGYFSAWNRARNDPQRAARAERAIRGALTGLPIDLQIETHLRLAEALRVSGRVDAARAERDAAKALLRQYDFTPEVRGAMVRDLARSLASDGSDAEARMVLAEQLARHEREAAEIVDIDRADCLRPMAEALSAVGDHAAALRCWAMALEAGRANPNARPRAEDLCLTCISMARSGVEPTESMWRSIRDIRDGLKDPW